ncbi:hypothetical protein E4U41_003441, partial [Claviceps citrina]
MSLWSSRRMCRLFFASFGKFRLSRSERASRNSESEKDIASTDVTFDEIEDELLYEAAG